MSPAEIDILVEFPESSSGNSQIIQINYPHPLFLFCSLVIITRSSSFSSKSRVFFCSPKSSRSLLIFRVLLIWFSRSATNYLLRRTIGVLSELNRTQLFSISWMSNKR